MAVSDLHTLQHATTLENPDGMETASGSFFLSLYLGNGHQCYLTTAISPCVYGTLNGRVEFKEPRHGEMKGAMIVITSNTCCVSEEDKW